MKTITTLALSNNKKNKVRSILTIITICLATILLTVICSYARGLIKYERLNAPKLYGNYYGTFSAVTDEKIEQVRQRSEFTKLGKVAIVGEVKNELPARLLYADETNLELTNMMERFEVGNYPVKVDEIAAQRSFFKQIGYDDVKLGDKISLPFRTGLSQKFEVTTFIVSGIIKDVDNGLETSTITGCVSKDFHESRVKPEDRIYTLYFLLNDSVPITTDNAQEVLIDLAEKCGIKENQVKENAYFLMFMLEPGIETITICGIISVCVMLFSVVVIYNIFQVGIVQKIQEYGKVKALGATKKQMRMIIFREGMLLAAVSIPTGLILGAVLSQFTFDWLIEQSNELQAGIEVVRVSTFSIPMLLLSAALAFITVCLALRKPMKIVGRISPIEAIRFLESTESKSLGIRKGKKEVKISSLAMANISGNKKRTLTTILTMGMSCILFVILANIIGNVDEEYIAREHVEHGQFMIELYYYMNDTAYPQNNLDNILKDNPLNEELIQKIKAIDGVTDIKTRNRLVARINGQNESVTVLDREDFEFHADSSKELGTLDYDEASKNGDILYGWSHFMEDEGYSINQEIGFDLFDGTKQEMFKGRLSGSFGRVTGDWVMTQDTFEKMNFNHSCISEIWVDCSGENIPGVKEQLEQLLMGTEHVVMNEFQQSLKQAVLSTKMTKTAVYAFLAILGVIGFMNLANTMIMNVITRKQEYGILQAVGMTNRQLNLSLQIQGMIFTFGTLIVALGIGLPIGYTLFHYAKGSGIVGLNIYHLPYVEVSIMVIALVFMQLILSFILSSNLKKESLVERIRYQE